MPILTLISRLDFFFGMIEIQRLHSAHQREVAALKSVYQSHIDSLSRNHRDDLLAAAKTVASLTGDLHRAFGAMSQTVDMVNKFQVCIFFLLIRCVVSPSFDMVNEFQLSFPDVLYLHVFTWSLIIIQGVLFFADVS